MDVYSGFPNTESGSPIVRVRWCGLVYGAGGDGGSGLCRVGDLDYVEWGFGILVSGRVLGGVSVWEGFLRVWVTWF